jgi:hypothetical protein
MLKTVKIRQLFPHYKLNSPEDKLLSLLKDNKLKNLLNGRERIGIALGSRGISNITVIVATLVQHLKELGCHVVIIPAMGSHGFADADGQKMVLEKLGIREETIKTKIVSSMEVITLGHVQMEGKQYPVYFDKAAWEQTDGIILLNRIKTHTDYTAVYESGLVKIATVGLGNHKGAEQVHSLGIKGLKELMPLLAEAVFNTNKVIGGLAIVEDAYHNTSGLHWLNRTEILDKEPGILERSKSLMPKMPIDGIDLLIIKQMGKDISGVGIDPKIIGRLMITGEDELLYPQIELIGVCDLTDATYGNALGVGLADFITRQLYDKIDYSALKENILTATFYQRGKIPLILENEREMLNVSIEHFKRRGKKQAKVIIIKDTLNLSDIYVSEGVLEEIVDREGIEIVSDLKEISFDKCNRIITDLF